MKTTILRVMVLAAVCGMLAVSTSYSSAVAENQDNTYEAANYCAADTLDADVASSDEALVASETTASEDVVPSACYFCSTHEDCWLTPDTRDGYCDSFTRCCVFY